MRILLAMLNNSKKNISQRGVTLAELSISIAIISLMIAGTFGGMSIVKAAKVRKSVSEFTSYMSAINEFKSQYKYLPGDLPTASDFWSGAHNGTGDEIVDENISEDLYVWEHLADAKLIPGSYTGVAGGGSYKYVDGTNSIGSEVFISGIFSFSSRSGTALYNTFGNIIRLGGNAASGPINPIMSGKDAYAIDAKIDDGFASTGIFYAVRNSASCTDADYSAVSANYILNNDLVDCKIFYWQKKL